MKRYIYALKDDLSEFKEVICDDSDACAIRGFKSIVLKMLAHGDYKPTSSSLYVDDLSLYRLGEFDTVTGLISGSSPEVLIRGKAVRMEIEASFSRREVFGNEEV